MANIYFDLKNINLEPTDKPYAIIIGYDCVTGLQTARILAKHKIPFIAIAADPGHFACYSKVCRHVIVANTQTMDFISKLVNLGPKLNQKAVLIPCTDLSVLQISRQRKKLNNWFYINLPEADTIEKLLDKAKFSEFAQKENLPVPDTFFLKNLNDAEIASKEISYPCFIKPPVKTSEWEKMASTKAYKVSSSVEFMEVYKKCSKWTDILIAQQWIEGEVCNQFTCNVYFNSDSEPMVTYVSQKLRQYPLDTGVGCFAIETQNDTVLYETIRLFKKVNYRGLGYLEMKRDERTGRYLIIEPNIGRPTGRSAMAEASGVDLMLTMYSDTIDLQNPTTASTSRKFNKMMDTQQKYQNLKWMYLKRDIISSFSLWMKGKLTFKEWWSSLKGPKVYAVFSWNDPVPFFRDIGSKMPTLIYRKLNIRKKSEKSYTFKNTAVLKE